MQNLLLKVRGGKHAFCTFAGSQSVPRVVPYRSIVPQV